MSSRIVRVMTLALAIASISVTYPVAKPEVQRAGPVADVRGLWVLRTSMTSPQSIAEVVRTAVAGGYNTLLVQVRGRGDAYYKSAIEPRATDLAAQPGAFDPLRTMLTTAHAARLKVHAWFNVDLIASATALPQSDAHVVRRHPEWLMVPRGLALELNRLSPASPAYLDRLARWTRGQSETVEGLYLSPITEESQAYTTSVVRSLATAYDIDGLHLDYTRYPTADFDYSALTLSAFRASRALLAASDERGRLDRESQSDPLVWTRAYPDAWEAFRRDRLTKLVQRIRESLKAARPDAVLSSAVLPDPDEARDAHMQDWERWAGMRLLDVLCPMAYATDPAIFADQLTRTAAASHGQPVWVGIGAWRLPVQQTASRLTMVHRSGLAGVVLFSYDSLISAGSPSATYFSRLRSTLLNPAGEPGRTQQER